jgi:hypothetical protein
MTNIVHMHIACGFGCDFRNKHMGRELWEGFKSERNISSLAMHWNAVLFFFK